MNSMRDSVTNHISSAIACLVAIGLLTSCGANGTDEQKLVSTYARVIIERESGLDSAVTAKHIDSIVRSSGFTQESFSEALRSHGNSATQLRQFYDSVSAELNRMRSDSTR
ncbi:MAG: hypothetical protein FGM32_00815 [Candidatus Kapabacteria bacterium]|nr:hypothetical protein [Candidatus Kapabacteria bacterium]